MILRRFFKNANWINQYGSLKLSPAERGQGPSFLQTWIPFIQYLGCLVPSMVKMGPVVLDKKLKMWKVYRDSKKSSFELSAKVS